MADISIKELIEEMVQSDPHKIILSGGRGEYRKMVFERKIIGGKRCFQIERYTEKQVFHQNIDEDELEEALAGIADVFVIGFVGEAEVSGVSLVNSFNAIFINLFTTLASDGAVVISQYIGRKEEKIDYEEKYWSTAGIISGTGNCSRSNSK